MTAWMKYVNLVMFGACSGALGAVLMTHRSGPAVFSGVLAVIWNGSYCVWYFSRLNRAEKICREIRERQP